MCGADDRFGEGVFAVRFGGCRNGKDGVGVVASGRGDVGDGRFALREGAGLIEQDRAGP